MDKGQTLQAHLLDEVSEGRVTDDLLRVLTDLVRPATQIAAEVNKAGLVNIIGLTGQKNVHGEEVKKPAEGQPATLKEGFIHRSKQTYKLFS